MSEGNSDRVISINTDSTITTTVLQERTGGIVPAPAPTPSLADATPATHSLIVDAASTDFQLITLMAGEGITITATADNLEIARSAVGYESVTVDVESQTAAPGASEYSLFNGADPQTTGTVSMKKLRTTGATISIADDGEFLDLAAHLTPSGSELSSIIHTPGVGNGNFLPGHTIARGPIAQLKRIAPLSSAVAVTSLDPRYVDIGVGFEMTNVSSTADHPVFVNSSDIQIVAKTLKPGTNVTISRPTFEQVEIAGPDETEINRMRVAGAPANLTTATGTQAIALGFTGVASGAYSLAIGGNASAAGAYSIAIGEAASAPDERSLAIGGSSVARHWCVAIGANSSIAVASVNSIAIGDAATVSHSESIALGSTTQCTAADTIVISDGEGAPATNGTSNSIRFIGEAFPIFEAYSDRAVHYGSQWHEYTNLWLLSNFSEKGETPINASMLSPNAQLYMPKIRNQDGSPAFNFVSDVNDSTMFVSTGQLGGTAGEATAYAISAGGAIGGAVLVGGAVVTISGIIGFGTVAATLLATGAPVGVVAASVGILAGGPIAWIVVGGIILIVGAVIATVAVTAIVSALIINWATDLWLQNHSVDWKIQLPYSWYQFAVAMGAGDDDPPFGDAAWTFEVINKAGQYGKLIFKIEDEAYANGYAYVEQRDGGHVQSWTNDSGEKQTIGISFVTHATLGWAVRYTVLTGAEGG